MNDQEAVLVFARYPREGRVKTRLARDLSAGLVLELHTAFLLDTMQAVAAGAWDTILFLADCSPADATAWRSSHQLPPSITTRPQQGADLGERLWNAYLETQHGFRRVVFIGSDTPGLPLSLIRRAFDLLIRKPAVIGPVPDGGYYLLGLSRPLPDLFQGIDWGSDLVLAQTLAVLGKVDYELLPEWNDVDELSDLIELRSRLESPIASAAPRTAACLERLDLF